MYGDSHGSPGQDDHFDPSSPYAPNPFEPATEFEGAVATDVKVAGPSAGDWSHSEMGEMDAYRPQRSRHNAGKSRNGMLVKVGVAAAAAAVVLGAAGAAMAMTGGSDSGKKATAAAPPKTQPQNMAPDVATLQNNADQNARKIVQDRASQAAQSDAGKAPPMSVKGATPTPSASSSSGSSGGGGGTDPMPASAAQAYAKSLLPSWGWGGSGQFGCLVNLWNRESGWNAHAANPSGAYGIPQALPGDKMASAGSDWQNNAETQIRWGFGYIKDRYGSPCGAWGHSQATGWY